MKKRILSLLLISLTACEQASHNVPVEITQGVTNLEGVNFIEQVQVQPGKTLIPYQKYQLEKIFQNHDPINDIDLNKVNLIPYETLHYDEIEKIWEAIDKNDDWSLFNNKIDSISKLKEANIINGLG